MKIKYQLWGIFSSLFIVVSLTTYIFILNTYEQRLQAGYEQMSIAQGYTILDQLSATYPDSPNRSIGYLERYGENLNGRLVMLNQEKKVFADSFQQLQPNTTLHIDILDQDFELGSIFTETESFDYVQYTLLPFQAIEGEGYLLIIQEADQLKAELESYQTWMIQTLLIVVLAFFLISYFISLWFSKPIEQIIFQLKKITPHKRTFSLKYQRRDEIKELIDTIQNMVEELNLYDERQQRFLSTSSHELKTPLTVIQLILENLPYVRENEEKYDEFVQDLWYQVKKMKLMVDQLLQINRIGATHLQKETLNVQEIQNYLLQSFQHIVQDKQMVLEFDLEPVNLFVDRTQFLGALDNLVSNAIRYSPQGQTVKITIKDDKEQSKISVCDQGIGISPKHLPNIFEPFYRSNDATAWNQEGSGLGLTIVKQVVNMHKGKIDIETEQNKGTCVHVFLPKL